MININFFEKEKRNVLPYAIIGGFLVGLLLLGTYFFVTHTRYESQIEENEQWLVNQAEDVTLSREISQVDQLTSQAVSVQGTLRENQYPMDTVTEDLMSFVPNEEDRVSSFQLSESTNQVSLILENTSTNEAQNIIEDLEEQTYVENVEFLRAEDQNQEEEYRFELFINLNMNVYAEEDVE